MSMRPSGKLAGAGFASSGERGGHHAGCRPRMHASAELKTRLRGRRAAQLRRDARRSTGRCQGDRLNSGRLTVACAASTFQAPVRRFADAQALRGTTAALPRLGQDRGRAARPIGRRVCPCRARVCSPGKPMAGFGLLPVLSQPAEEAAEFQPARPIHPSVCAMLPKSGKTA